MQNDDLLTAEQVARSLGISVKTLRRMIRDGAFPDSFSVSEGVRRWTGKDVRSFLHLRSRIGTRRITPLDEAGDDSGQNSEKNLEGHRPPRKGTGRGQEGET